MGGYGRRVPPSESSRHRSTGPAAFFTGAGAVFVGLRLIARDRNLRKLTAVPVVLTALLYLGLVGAAFFWADDALGLLWAQPDVTWLVPLWYLAWFAGIATFFLLAILLFSTVAEIVGGPFYERMAARILEERGLTVEPPTLLDGTVLDVVRSLMFVVPAACLALIGLIPGIGLPFAVLGATLAWLGLGSGAVNPSLLVTGHRFGARVSYVWRHFFVVLGLGGVVALSVPIPFLPLISIPCSIAGAADLYRRGILGPIRRGR